MAGGVGSDRGSGGMASKLAAAKIAAWSGVRAVIAQAGRDRAFAAAFEIGFDRPCGQDGVARELQNLAAIAVERIGNALEYGVHDSPQFFRAAMVRADQPGSCDREPRKVGAQNDRRNGIGEFLP